MKIDVIVLSIFLLYQSVLYQKRNCGL